MKGFVCKLLFLFGLLLTTNLVHAQQDKHRVLLLLSYHPTFPTSSKIISGLEEAFDLNQIDLEIEFMDSKRHASQESIHLFKQSFANKLKQREKYDVIVTADDNALHFYLDNQHGLFMDTPNVFLGVNNVELALSLESNQAVTGVVEEISIAENIELIKRVRPSNKNIHIILDGTTTGQSNLNSIFKLNPNLVGVNLILINLANLNWDEYLIKVRQLTIDDNILLLTAYRDKTNSSLEFDQSLALLSANTDAAIFHPFEHGIGQGVLGGVVISHWEQAHQAAIKANQLLNGFDIDQILIMAQSPNVVTFDQNYLDKYSIPNQLIPSSAVVLFKQETVINQYLKEIIAISIVFMLMLIMIFLLIYQNRLRLLNSRALQIEERKLHTILDSIDAYIYTKDMQGIYQFANKATRELYGLSLDKIKGIDDFSLNTKEQAQQIMEADAVVFDTKTKQKFEATTWSKQLNRVQETQTTKIPLLDENGDMYALCGISVDVTEQNRQTRKLEQAAHYDPLTGLPNRTFLFDVIQDAMLRTGDAQHSFILLYFDLDGFKDINDDLGHEAGDQILVEVSDRVKSTLRDKDIVARLGGDEFIVLLFTALEPSKNIGSIKRILSTISMPAVIERNMVQVTASIGVTHYPQKQIVTPEQLLRQADQHMYTAKNHGKNCFSIYDEHEAKMDSDGSQFLARISQALSQREFELYYQPKINNSDGTLVSVEGLIRWNHPEHGVLGPYAFLPAIEQKPIMFEVDEYVVFEAFWQLTQWKRQGLSIPVSINISYACFETSSLPALLDKALQAYPEVEPSLVEIEITETQALSSVSKVVEQITICKQKGFRFALDDFGTGYSSLDYLKQLPVDTLKIDKSFILNMLDQDDDQKILKGIIGLSRAFGLDTVAEGVESLEHAKTLTALGCTCSQGFYIAKPLTSKDLEAWLESWSPQEQWFVEASNLVE
jgi:diguanylate cyclase (GGDEF)-like protein